MNYKDITIEEAETIYNKLQCDIVCDADKQEIIFENYITEIVNNLKDVFNELIRIAGEVAKVVVQAFNNIKEYVIKLYNKKISKKRFIKLLQSAGMQRNEINKLIKNNKDKYTMWRYLQSIPPHL